MQLIFDTPHSMLSAPASTDGACPIQCCGDYAALFKTLCLANSMAGAFDSPTFELASALIAHRSITPEDSGCQALLIERLQRLGFVCTTLQYSGVTNLWARKGVESPVFCFAGHTDVVPTGPLDQWETDPFTADVREGYLYGRGAADMKTSLAAFIVSIERYLKDKPNHRGSIALLLTSDEEGVATDGTVKVVDALQARGESIDYCVVGEPTSVDRLGDMIKNGRRGSLSGTLIVNGVQGHVAYPQLAQNPIHLVAPALAELAQTRWDDGDEHFPATTWQISNIHAGTGATNVIPGKLELLFNFRHAPVSSRQDLQQRFETILKKHGLNYELTWPGVGDAYITRPGKLVSAARQAIRTVTGIESELSCTGGTSDGRFIARICPEVIEFGPVNATIHKVNERVRVADLEPLSHIYQQMLQNALQAPDDRHG